MQAGSLAVVVSNETWTRQRKFDLQLDDSPVCRVCQGTEREEADTIHHRKFSCQGIEKLKGVKTLAGYGTRCMDSIWVDAARGGKCGFRLG